MDGAEVVEYNDTSVTWHWSETLGMGAWTPATGAVGDVIELPFDLPADVGVSIGARVIWSDDGRTLLTMSIRGPDGAALCNDSQSATGPDGVSPSPLACTTVVHPSAQAGTGSVYVDSTANPNDSLKIEIEVTMETVPYSAFQAPTVTVHGDGGTIVPIKAQLPGVETFEIDVRAFEPTLGIDEDGAVFYQGWLSSPIHGGDPTVMRSTNDGSTWEEVSPAVVGLDPHTATVDPFLHVDRDTGRVFTMHYLMASGACHELSYSDDKGTSWTTVPVCGYQDFQKLWTGPPATSAPVGYPNLVYLCSIVGGLGSPYSVGTGCSKSLDGGRTFIPTGEAPFLANPVVETDGPMKGRCFAGALPGAVGPDGTLYLVRGWCDELYVAVSHDEGATWERFQVSHNGLARDRIPPPLVSATNDEYPVVQTTSSVAVDADGTVYAAWLAEDRLVYLAHSSDQGRTWSEARMVTHPDVTEANHPTIDVGEPGHVAIGYMGSPDSPFPEDGLDSDYESVRWTGYITTTDNGLGADSLFFSAPVRPIADPLVIGVCTPEVCPGAGDFFDLDIGPDGTPWASFVDVQARPGVNGMGIVSRMVGPSGAGAVEVDP